MSTNGGPAFPQHGFDIVAERFTSQGGMTLRDYFAAKAMQGMLSDPTTPEIMDIGGAAYAMADAMLEARMV